VSIAESALAGASIANATPTGGTTKKPPPKRSFVAVADTKLIPEPR
jgi:hypothetical protein